MLSTTTDPVTKTATPKVNCTISPMRATPKLSLSVIAEAVIIVPIGLKGHVLFVKSANRPTGKFSASVTGDPVIKVQTIG